MTFSSLSAVAMSGLAFPVAAFSQATARAPVTASNPLAEARRQLAAARDFLGLGIQGATVVQDIFANAGGGVVVSCFESVRATRPYCWSKDDLEARLASRMRDVWRHVCSHAAGNLNLRAAATAIAVSQVAEAYRLRGLYP